MDPKFKCSGCGKEFDMNEKSSMSGDVSFDPRYGGLVEIGGSSPYCRKCYAEFLRLNSKTNSHETSNEIKKITEKQKNYLKSLGYGESMEELTIVEASELIKDLLKKKT
jgi:transposase-like protein